MFKRYSNPFSLIDNLIITNQFSEFIDTFIKQFNQDLQYEFWLHKVFDKSFSDYQASIDNSVNAQHEFIDKDEIKTTINKSNEILSDFKPY